MTDSSFFMPYGGYKNILSLAFRGIKSPPPPKNSGREAKKGLFLKPPVGTMSTKSTFRPFFQLLLSVY